MANRKKRASKRHNEWAGCHSIPAVFAFAFRYALADLSGSDVALVARTTSVPKLGWLAPEPQRQLATQLDMLAKRARTLRYRARVGDRDRLLEILGDAGLDDARRLFILAWTIDDTFTEFGVDRPAEATGANVAAARRGYFDDIPNGPPPLGQMTAAAALRGRFRNFLYLGPVHKFDAFGPLPTPQQRSLPARLAQRLESAMEDELRVAVVSWRPHAHEDLVEAPDAGPGLFAYAGYSRAIDRPTVESVFSELAQRRIHVAVFHEISATPPEAALIEATLRERKRAHPVLTAVGLMHEPTSAGSYSNRALLLGSDGTTLLEHEKLEPFTDPQSRQEAIIPRRSQQYEYLDSPIGRLTVNICRDVRSDVPALLNRLMGVAAVLVPAYSRNLDFALEEGRVLGARQRAMLIAVNALRTDLNHLAVAYFPVRGKRNSERWVAQPEVHDGAPVVRSASVSRDGQGHLQISDFV